MSSVLEIAVVEKDAVWSLWQVLAQNCSTHPEVLEKGHSLSDSWEPSCLVSEAVSPPKGEKAPQLGDLGTISH